MQFLKTLFWVAVAVVLVLFAKGNWFAVTLRLWGGLELDVKLPVLVLAAFLLGFLPTFLLYRARMWSMKRRMEPLERNVIAAPTVVRAETATPPVAADDGTGERVATDSKIWPTA
jgi:putative membrane protein